MRMDDVRRRGRTEMRVVARHTVCFFSACELLFAVNKVGNRSQVFAYGWFFRNSYELLLVKDGFIIDRAIPSAVNHFDVDVTGARKFVEHNQYSWLLVFIDLKSAFDKVHREAVWDDLQQTLDSQDNSERCEARDIAKQRFAVQTLRNMYSGTKLQQRIA